MSDDTTDLADYWWTTVLPFFFAFAALGVLSTLEGKRLGHLEAQNDAVLHHAAHFEPDAKGNPVFTWNTP